MSDHSSRPSYDYIQYIRVPDHRLYRDSPFADNFFMDACHEIISNLNRNDLSNPIDLMIYDRANRTMVVYGNSPDTVKAAYLIKQLSYLYSWDELQENSASQLLKSETARRAQKPDLPQMRSAALYFNESMRDFSESQKTSLNKMTKFLAPLGVAVEPNPLHDHGVVLSAYGDETLLRGRLIAQWAIAQIDQEKEIRKRDLLKSLEINSRKASGRICEKLYLPRPLELEAA